MVDSTFRTIADLKQFLCVSDEDMVRTIKNDVQRYAHISQVLQQFAYSQCSKHDKGVLRLYLQRTSGYGRAQVTRLIAQWQVNQQANMQPNQPVNQLVSVPLVKRYRSPAKPFERKYTPADIALLVEMDRANPDVGGPAIVHLLKRACHVFDDARYERLATLSSSHLYNLRKSEGYLSHGIRAKKTLGLNHSIGVRKPPTAHGCTGVVRIANVYQNVEDGDLQIYHIRCVDSTSQWQIDVCTQGISDAFLLPVLALALQQFPFAVERFHADIGSEYIIHRVAKALEKLRKEQAFSQGHYQDAALHATVQASRAHSAEDALAIAEQVKAYNTFYQRDLNPWLNMHRPCMFASTQASPSGQLVKTYKHADVKTPLEALALLDQQGLVQFNEANALRDLQKTAMEITDLFAAQKMQRAKRTLVQSAGKKKAVIEPLVRTMLCAPAWATQFSTPPVRSQDRVSHYKVA